MPKPNKPQTVQAGDVGDEESKEGEKPETKNKLLEEYNAKAAERQAAEQKRREEYDQMEKARRAEMEQNMEKQCAKDDAEKCSTDEEDELENDDLTDEEDTEDGRAKSRAAASARPGDVKTYPAKIDISATATVTLTAADSGKSGSKKLARFDMVANTGAPMNLKGWKYPVVLDMDGGNIPSQTLPARMNHDPNLGVGHTDRIGVLDGQLHAEGSVSRETEEAREVVASSKNGFPWQASVGASVERNEWVPEGRSAEANGREYRGPVNIARAWSLGEISFVDRGADPNTVARIAAMAKQRADNGDPVDGGESIGQEIVEARAERKRIEGIRALTVEALKTPGADIDAIESAQQSAIEGGNSLTEFELALLRLNRPRAPQIRRGDLPTPKVLEAALCMGCGISDQVLAKDRDYGEEIVQKAYPLRNRGLRGTIAAALEAAGVPVPHGNRELFQAVLEHQNRHGIQAQGFSTVNLPGILGNVANKVLLLAFTAVDATYDKIAEQADFSNFQTHTMYRLDHLGEFATVAPTGELHHGNLSQTSFTNQLDTKGQILVLSRQSIINDDLNAFQSLAAQLARKARIAVERALYAKVMEASNVFYTSGQGNLFTSSPLGITNLGQAEAALLDMADAYGDPIYAQPKYLLVPPALRFLGQSIYTSQEMRNPSATQDRPVGNPYVGRFEVVTSPYLASSVLSGSSATTWYLIADPMMLPAFQVAYLDGERAPTIQTADAQFNTLGLQMRCFFDFGVAQLDYRGAIKNTA